MGVLALVAAAIAVFFLTGVLNPSRPVPTPSPSVQSQVVETLTSLDVQRTEAVGAAGIKSPLQKVSAAPLVGPQGKPEVLYIGAEFCPFCAAQRWSLLIAMARFGTFSGVGLTTSSGTDVFPNTPTLTFAHSAYQSDFLEFAAVEETDRDHNALQTPTADQERVFEQLNSRRSIPFVDFGSRYVTLGASFQPDVLQGMSWQQIAEQLANNPQGPAAARILGVANWMTAAICQQLSAPPASVCGGPEIGQLRSQL